MLTRKRGKRKLKGDALFETKKSYRVCNRKDLINMPEIEKCLKLLKVRYSEKLKI
ncbi:MAG TPA: hypothetical protein PL032_09755 [Syntrophorhabdus sp.]|nr:hypothetical protein [Syntrophorhabdus sp.]